MTKVLCLATLGTLLAGAFIPTSELTEYSSAETDIGFHTNLVALPEVIFSPKYTLLGTYVDNALFDLLPEIPQYVPEVKEEIVYVRERSAYPTAEQWYRLRMCEATDNPRAISPQGWYRGLYQFDLPTWRSVGGTGDPIDASREEQDYRAQLLYNQRGTQPWPVCGRFLR